MSSVMLMVHSVMMMVSLLLDMVLGVMFVAPVRRVSVVNHVDAVAGRLASPNFNDAALGDDAYLLTAALMMILVVRRQASGEVARRFP